MKKKLTIIIIIFSTIILIGVLGSFSNTQSAIIGTQFITSTSSTAHPTPKSSPNLSNSRYYINSNGKRVHSPAYSNTIPSGASAICRDGTYSFSQHRRGTCSHHGGVAQWL